MADETAILVLEVDGPVDSALGEQLSQLTGLKTRTTLKRGLEGELGNWIIIVEYAIKAVAALTPILVSYLETRRVRSIKVGNNKIDNPRPEDIDLLLRTPDARGHESV